MIVNKKKKGRMKRKQDVTKATPAYTDTGYRIPGAQAIRVDPVTGEQIPILLPEANVYSDSSSLDSIERAVGGGGLFAQMANEYETPISLLNQASLISQIGQEFTGIPGAARAVNRTFGEDTISGNKLFETSEEDPTLDKAFDYMDLAGILPLAGAATGTKNAFRVLKNATNNVVYSPTSLKAMDRLLKESKNRSKAQYGGLLSQPFVTSYQDDIIREASKPMNDYKKLLREKRDLEDWFGDDINLPEYADQKQRLDEINQRLSGFDRSTAKTLSDLETNMTSIENLTPEARGLLINSISNILRKPTYNDAGTITNNSFRDAALIAAMNRVAQVGPKVPVMGAVQRDLAGKIMERSGGVQKLNMGEVIPVVKEYAKKFGNVTPVSKGAEYKGIKYGSFSERPDAPNLVNAFLYGDFKNFKPVKSEAITEKARDSFKQYYDQFGDLEVKDLPTMLKTSEDKPIKFTQNLYGGLIMDESAKVNNTTLKDDYINGDVFDLEKPSRPGTNDIENKLANTTSKTNFADPGKIYNVEKLPNGLPSQFTVNADEGQNFYTASFDIAGHQQRWELMDVKDGQAKYKVTVYDIWKFDPGPYSKKWSDGEDMYRTSKQAAMLHGTGKPFVTGTEHYISMPEPYMRNAASATP